MASRKRQRRKLRLSNIIRKNGPRLERRTPTQKSKPIHSPTIRLSQTRDWRDDIIKKPTRVKQRPRRNALVVQDWIEPPNVENRSSPQKKAGLRGRHAPYGSQGKALRLEESRMDQLPRASSRKYAPCTPKPQNRTSFKKEHEKRKAGGGSSPLETPIFRKWCK